MHPEIKKSLIDFLKNAIQVRTQWCEDSIRGIKTSETWTSKVSATYRIIGATINLQAMRIWRILSQEITLCMKKQDLDEDHLYSKFLLLKDDQEQFLEKAIPVEWYDEAFRALAEQNNELRGDISKCLFKYAELATSLQERCLDVQYPHGEHGLVDGRELIRFAQTMDIPTFIKVLTVRGEVE